MRTNTVVQVLAAIVCVVLLGCRGNPAPESTASEPSSDEKVLRALEGYEPLYKVDDEGRVTHLKLVWRHLPGPVLAEVGKLSELQGLDLAYSTVNDKGLAHLEDLQQLRSLSLWGTPVTDRGLVHLEKLPGLQWLWLPKKTVTAAAVEKLKEARPGLTVYLQ